MTRALPLPLAFVFALGAVTLGVLTHARGEPIRDTTHRYQIAIDARAWTALPVDTSHTEPLRAMRSKDGHRLLVITRVSVSNPLAWRNDRYFFETVERGVRDSAPGYKRMHRKRRRLTKRVPAFDLVFARNRDGTRDVVSMRFLFFRRYTLTLAVSTPLDRYKRTRRTTRRLMESFRPHLSR